MSLQVSSDSTESPFGHLKIASFDALQQVSKRSKCTKCRRSRMHYCYSCYLPVEELRDKLPTVKVPLKIDIIKHPREVEGKSTAVHAAILAPDDVKVYTYPCVPEFQDKNKVLLVFPDNDSITMDQLAANIAGTRTDVCENLATTSAAHECVEEAHSVTVANGVLPVYSEQANCCAVKADSKMFEGVSALKDDDGITSQVLEGVSVLKDDDGSTSRMLEGARSLKDDGITTVESRVSSNISNTEHGTIKSKDLCMKNSITGTRHATADNFSVPNKKLKLERHVALECADCKFERVLFIDSTWNQVKSICTDERLKDLTKIKLCKHRTLFWRYQRQSDNYLATIEAIYYFLVEYHETVLCSKYEGQYDNLLYFFSFMFDKIRNEYEVNTVLKSYSEKRNYTVESNDDT